MKEQLKPYDEPCDPYPLSAKPEDIQRWIEEGKKKGAVYLIEMTDSFDWHDYPVYVMPGEDPEKIKAAQTKDMVYVSRVFDLREGSVVNQQGNITYSPPKNRFNWLKMLDVIFGSIFFLIVLYPQLKWSLIPVKLFALLAQIWIIYSFIRVLIYSLSLTKSAKEAKDAFSLTSTNNIDQWIERVKGILSSIAFSVIGILLAIEFFKGQPVETMFLFAIGSLFCFTLGIISFLAVFPFKKVTNNDKNRDKVG